MDLKKSQNDIVFVSFAINSLVLIIGFIWQNLALSYLTIGINMVLMGVHLIITKNFVMFQGILTVNKLAKSLDNKLGEVHGQVSG